MALSSLLPMAFAMTSLLPSEMPMNRFTIKLTIGEFAPTAATAAVRFCAAKLPTTAIAKALNSCPRIAVAAIGSAKRGSPRQMDSCSMSFFCLPIKSSSESPAYLQPS